MSLLEVLFLMPNWLFSCNTITSQKYFWCSQFSHFDFVQWPKVICSSEHVLTGESLNYTIHPYYVYFIACLVLWSYLLGSFSGFLASHVSKSVELFQDCKQQCTSDSGLICISMLIFKKRASNLVSTIIHFNIFFFTLLDLEWCKTITRQSDRYRWKHDLTLLVDIDSIAPSNRWYLPRFFAPESQLQVSWSPPFLSRTT